MIGTITFNPSIDRYIVVRNLVKDDANRAEAICDRPGGKGINVSKVVRELGGRTRAFSLTGGLTGEMLKELVRGLDISMATVEVAGHTRINTILSDVKDGTQTRISAPGPRLTPRDIALFQWKLLALRPRPFLWALGGSLPQGTPPSTYQKFVLALQKSGTPCILDTDDEALKLGVRARPFMIKPNEYEIARLLGRRFHGLGDYFEAGRQLVREGVRIVVISLAEKGALYVTREKAFHVQVPDVRATSKLGAGDSLIGGLALGLSRKKSLEEAARLAAAASVSAVLREAPRLCRRSDIPKLLKRIRIKQL